MANALRKFSDGDVFYSEDLDSLFAWSNLRFANAAARDAALVGTYAPVTGTRVALADENQQYRRVGTNWIPMPGTICFSYASAAVKDMSYNGASVVLTNWGINLLGSRNLNNWFNPSTGYFTPTLPGYYEFNAAVAVEQPAGLPVGQRQLGLSQYLSGNNTWISQAGMIVPTYGAGQLYLHLIPTVVALPAGAQFFLFGINTGNGSVNMTPTANNPAFFSAKYLGA